LHPDFPHGFSPPLLAFVLVLFNEGEQFLIAETFAHPIKAPALAPYFR
jgi:hypothetical protein